MKNPLSPITKIDLDEAFNRYDEKNRKYRDQVLNGLDKVMGELEAMREDSMIGTYQIRNLREDVDGHEQRIAKLESTTQQ